MRLPFLLLCASFAFAAAPAHATYIAEVEANDSQATAQNVDAAFSLGADPDIKDGLDSPHASIQATGDDTFDYYSFTVPVGGARLIIDLDYGSTSGLDGHIRLLSPGGSEIANDDDSDSTRGAGGSQTDYLSPGPTSYDPILEIVVANGGLYAVEVGRSAFGNPGYAEVTAGTSYTLHISVPEPAALSLLGLGLGLAAARLRRR